MNNALWFSIACALWLGSHCNDTVANQSTNDYYKRAVEKLREEAINCSKYIPSAWRQIMQNSEPPFDPISNRKEYVPQQYLFDCLRAELRHMDEASPFSLAARNSDESRIEYNIALNEVVSLGFDGTLVTKARSYSYIVQVHYRVSDCVIETLVLQSLFNDRVQSSFQFSYSTVELLNVHLQVF